MLVPEHLANYAQYVNEIYKSFLFRQPLAVKLTGKDYRSLCKLYIHLFVLQAVSTGLRLLRWDHLVRSAPAARLSVASSPVATAQGFMGLSSGYVKPLPRPGKLHGEDRQACRDH